MLAGQSLDNNLQLCWELFLDSLLFHSSGCILYLSIMENEQCKPRPINCLLVNPHTVLICSICWWQVPHTTFLLTHACFLFYHVASNMTLRRLRHFIADLPENIQWAAEAAWILALSYFIAYLETLAISNVCCNKPFCLVFYYCDLCLLVHFWIYSRIAVYSFEVSKHLDIPYSLLF